MKAPTLAVVTETHLCYIIVNSYGKYEYVEENLPFTEFISIAQLFELAHDKQLTRLWIHLPVKKQRGLTDEYLQNCEDTCKILTFEDEKTKQYVKPSFKNTFYFVGNIKKEGEYTEEVGIAFLANNHCDYDVYEDDLAKDVFSAIYYLESALNIPMTYSTGRVGQELIKEKLAKSHNNHILKPKQNMSLFKEITGASTPFQRPITLEEANRKYVIYIDINAAYLAHSKVNLGVGEYIELEKPEFNRYYPGLWNVSIKGSSIFDGKKLPFPCRILQDNKTEGWLYTPTVNILLNLGYDIEILSSKIWNKSSKQTKDNTGMYSKLLETWMKDLSDVYEDFRIPLSRYKNKRALEIAKDALKGIYAKALSGLSHDKVYKSTINRTDWYHMILSEVYARVIRDVNKFYQIGLHPFLIVTDGMFFATDCETVEEMFNKAPLHMEKKPGHYKLVYRLPMQACKDILLQDMAVNEKIVKIAKIKRSLGE